MEYSPGKLISAIKQDLTALINVKLELLKLDAYEKTSKVAALMAYGSIILFVAFFALFFAFFALGFWLGQITGSQAEGFGLVMLLYFIALVIVLVLRKRLLSYFINYFLKVMDSGLSGKDENKLPKNIANE